MRRILEWMLWQWRVRRQREEGPSCTLCRQPSTTGTTLLWQDERTVRRGVVQPENGTELAYFCPTCATGVHDRVVAAAAGVVAAARAERRPRHRCPTCTSSTEAAFHATEHPARLSGVLGEPRTTVALALAVLAQPMDPDRGDTTRMPLALPSVHAAAAHHTVTLAELRELVAAAEHLPPETIVRGSTIPFKMSDLGNLRGGCITTLALDTPEVA